MSEPIPESVPTSQDPRSKRPTKKRALTPLSAQAAQVDALFAKPDQEIKIPTGPVRKTLAPPPEIVPNVQGSSAGAGSGEFHVYKASRRREYERLRLMDEEVKKEQQDKEFNEKREEARKRDEEKTNKNRARREKQRQRKEKLKEAKNSSISGDDAKSATPGPGKRLGANPNVQKARDEEQDTQDTQDNPTAGDVNPAETGLVIHDED